MERKNVLRNLFAASCTEKACLFTGLFLVIMYGWIEDDAYIYFRYIDNFLIHANGLVFNPGEYVEGFSSPLWLVFLAACRFLHANYWFAIRLTGILAFLVFWYLAVQINRRLVPVGENGIILNMPLIYLTCNYGVMSYFTSGLETPLILIAAAVYCAIFLFPASIWLLAAVGLSPLVRHEFALPFIFVFGWLWKTNRRFPKFLCAVAALTSIPYQLFRIWYYADLFPNTFYLKDTAWVTQGLRYLYDTAIAYDIVPLLGLATVAYCWARKTRGRAFLMEDGRALMIITALPVLAYVVKIGGTYQHFRYAAFPVCMCVFATSGLAEIIIAHIHRRHARLILTATLFIALLFFSNYPRQLQQHPIFRSHFNYSCRYFLKISDAANSRFDGSRITPDLFALFPEELSYSRAAEVYANQKTAIFSHYWCQAAYANPRNYVIHSLGLTEPFLARTQMPPASPAHKWGLEKMAPSITEIRSRYGFIPGAFASALRQKNAPDWVANNIDAILLIEQKIYNRHVFLENLKLSFTPVPAILP